MVPDRYAPGIEFPPYEAACYEDPAWGINPNKTHDCAKPRGPIWKVGWAGVADKWPGAAKAIGAFTISNAEMDRMIARIDLDGEQLDAVIADWMAQNEAVWQGWIAK